MAMDKGKKNSKSQDDKGRKADNAAVEKPKELKNKFNKDDVRWNPYYWDGYKWSFDP